MTEPKCETRYEAMVEYRGSKYLDIQYKLNSSPTPSDEEGESSDEEGDAFGPKKEKVEEDPLKSKAEVWTSSNNISDIFRGKTTGRDGHERSAGRRYKSEC